MENRTLNAYRGLVAVEIARQAFKLAYDPPPNMPPEERVAKLDAMIAQLCKIRETKGDCIEAPSLGGDPSQRDI